MSQGTIMPTPWFTGLDDNGDPVIAGLLYTYAAGTTTLLDTFSDVDLTVANSNPVVLDGGGRAVLFLQSASYKFVLKDADGVTIKTQDNIGAVAPFTVNLDIAGVAGENIAAEQTVYLSDGSGSLSAGRWYLASGLNDYSSSLPYVSMSPNAIAVGEAGTFRLQGRVPVTGPLTPGSSYYVSDTLGALSTSPGTNSRKVGVADTTTSIVMSPNPPETVPDYLLAQNILANQSFS